MTSTWKQYIAYNRRLALLNVCLFGGALLSLFA